VNFALVKAAGTAVVLGRRARARGGIAHRAGVARARAPDVVVGHASGISRSGHNSACRKVPYRHGPRVPGIGKGANFCSMKPV
jgi:hypothetical protein